jgi:RND family efflux transporter MFP subunit
VLLLVAMLAGCGDEAALEEVVVPVPPVEALQARSGSLPLEERVNGVVRADNQVVVRPEVSGRVIEVLARSGDAVVQGQPLVRLDAQRLRDQLRQAEADLRLAEAGAAGARARRAELEAEVTRTRELAAQDLVSTLELETQEARWNAAQAAAAEAQARSDQAAAVVDERRFALERAVVRAPTSGRVGRREVEVGSMADPGTPLFVLGDLDDLVVEIPLTEQMLSFVRVGQPVRITPRTGGRAGTGSGGEPQPVRATLSRISPFLERDSFTTLGEIDTEGAAAGLRPGMFVTVDVLYGESEQATLVPASALWEDPRTGVQGIYVFTEPLGASAQVAAGGGTGMQAAGAMPADPSEQDFAVELRPVEVVAEGRAVLGVRGVAPGEWVVVVGQHLLAAADSPRARVRAASWERVLGLQDLQREDLLTNFLAKQQRLGRERGAQPPSNDDFLRGAPAAGAPAADEDVPPGPPSPGPLAEGG